MSSNAVGIFEINDRGQVYTIIGRAGSGPVCVHHCAISSSALQDQSSIERYMYVHICICMYLFPREHSNRMRFSA